MLNSGAASWKSRRQDCLSLSTSEAEYVATGQCGQIVCQHTAPFPDEASGRLNLSGPATVMVFFLEDFILFSGRAHPGDSDIQRCCLFLKIRRPAVHDSVHLGSVLVDPPLVLNP